MENPTNADIMKAFEDHRVATETRFSKIEASIPTEEKIGQLFHQSLSSFFEQKGASTKNVLIILATVIGSVTVILGGLKSILAWIGFTYLGK